jgi:hypothetical protein
VEAASARCCERVPLHARILAAAMGNLLGAVGLVRCARYDLITAARRIEAFHSCISMSGRIGEQIWALWKKLVGMSNSRRAGDGPGGRQENVVPLSVSLPT